MDPGRKKSTKLDHLLGWTPNSGEVLTPGSYCTTNVKAVGAGGAVGYSTQCIYLHNTSNNIIIYICLYYLVYYIYMFYLDLKVIISYQSHVGLMREIWVQLCLRYMEWSEWPQNGFLYGGLKGALV